MVVLFSVAIIWLNRQADQLRTEAQTQTAQLLARGLSNALSTALISRDYAGLETRLVQALADEQVVSALVVDLEGKLLSQIQRNPATGDPEPIFDLVEPKLPPEGSENYTERQQEQLIVWQRIEPGISLGWLRLITQPSQVSTLLDSTIQRMTLATVGIAFILLLVLAAVFIQTHRLVKARETDLLAGQRLLETAATHDTITSLPNRRGLLERLGQAIAENRLHPHNLAVCYLDLDGFKQINDTLGHEAGDYVLAKVAHRLRGCVRHQDTVARLGGDEFVLLLEGVENDHVCEEILQRVVSAIRQPLWYRNSSLSITVSLGLSRFPSDAHTADALLRQADQAMYRAKRAGKNCWRWYQIPTQA